MDGDATTTGIRRALLDLTLGDTATANTTATRVRSAGEADDVVRLAWAWRVVPRLQERVVAGVSLGPDADARLSELAIAAAAQSTLFFHRAGDVLARLEHAGVRAAAFKGVAAIASLYGTPAARMLRDVDVVIDPQHVGTAVRTLMEAGFELTDEIGRKGVDEWIDMLHSPSLDLRNLYVSLRNDEGFEADVHLQIGPTPPPRMLPEALLNRRVRATAAGVDVPVLAPVDLMLLNVYHTLKDLLALTSAARDLNDLAAWWGRGHDRWSLDELVPAAREACLEAPLLAYWRVISRADAGGPVGDGVTRLDAEADPAIRRDAALIVELFDRLVDTGRLSSGIISTLSPGRVRRYLDQRRHRTDAARSAGPASALGSDAGAGLAGANPGANPGADPGADRGGRLTLRGFAAGVGRVVREGADRDRLAAYRALVRAQRRYR